MSESEAAADDDTAVDWDDTSAAPLYIVVWPMSGQVEVICMHRRTNGVLGDRRQNDPRWCSISIAQGGVPSNDSHLCNELVVLVS
jgi:hypothetical protein